MIFGFHKKKRINLVVGEIDNFITILTRIKELLSNANLMSQAHTVQQALELLSAGKITAFIESVNNVSFWGSTGAIWEAQLFDEKTNGEYELEIIRFIDLVQKTRICNSEFKFIWHKSLKARIG